MTGRPRASTPARHATVTAPLLEREHELTAIRRALADVRAGNGQVVVISGPAGIGKTRLLDAGRAEAERLGLQVLAARSGIFEREHGYGVTRQWFASLAPRVLRAVVEHGGVGAAAALTTGDPPAPLAADSEFVVLNGLFWATSAVAEAGPVLLCLDDAHWADEASLRYLDFIARRLDELPVLLLVAIRTGECTDSTAPSALHELRAAEGAVELCPTPLSDDGVLELARVQFGPHADPAFSAACHEWTGGNPLLVSELMATLASGGASATPADVEHLGSVAPSAVSRTVLLRLSRLGPEAIELARAVAVLGDGACLPDAADLAQLSRSAAAGAAQALAEVSVLGSGSELRFVHPIVRAAVYEDRPAAVVAECHARAARLLYERGRGAEQAAGHLVRAPRTGDRWTVAVLGEAAAVMASRGAADAAVSLLARALEEPPVAPYDRAETLAGLGAAQAALNDADAVRHLSEAFELFPPGDRRAQVGLGLARLQALGGALDAMYRTVARSLACAEDRELVLLLEALEIIGRGTDPTGWRQLPATRVDAARALPGETAGERAMLAAVGMECCRGGHDSALEVAALAARAIESGGCDLTSAVDGYSPLALVTLVMFTGSPDRAAALSSDLVDQARALGSAMLYAEACACRAMAHWLGGALGEAEADARAALATVGAPFGVLHPVANGALVNVLTEQGRTDEALEVAGRFAVTSARQDRTMEAVTSCCHGRLERVLGNQDRALDLLMSSGAIMEGVGLRIPGPVPWREQAALTLLATGRRDAAREVIAPAVDAARRFRAPYGLGIVLRAAALIEEPVDVSLLLEALDVLEESEHRLEHARVLVDLGAALRRAGQRTEAITRLRAGLDLARACAAHTLTAQAETELRAAGARPTRRPSTGADALTASERRVCELAASGLGNVEISRQLFVTRKTVETHLGAAYRKLGIGSRAELDGALGPSSRGPSRM